MTHYDLQKHINACQKKKYVRVGAFSDGSDHDGSMQISQDNSLCRSFSNISLLMISAW